MAKDFVRQLLNKLFPSEKQSADKGREVNEPLVRGGSYTQDYTRWKESSDPGRLRSILRRMYDQTREGSSSHTGFRVYADSRAQGFYADTSLGLKSNELTYLADYFRDLLVDAGYRVNQSDRRHREVDAGVEVRERHLLKPNHVGGSLPREEPLFGSVTIENVEVNGNGAYLMVKTSRHTGRNFTEPKPFGELVDLLLG